MKKIILIVLAIIITINLVMACSHENVFIKSYEYNKIINNKNHIVQVFKESYPEGEYIGTVYDIDKAYQMVQSMKNIKKSNISVCDADSCYIFKFDDGTSVKINFEGKFLHYKGQNYEIIK